MTDNLMNRRHRIISADVLLDLSNGECEHLVARSTTDLRFTLQSSLQNLLKKRRTLKAGNGRDHWHMNKSLFKKSVHREQSGKERFIYFDRPAAQQKWRRWPYSVFSVEDLERHRRVIKFFKILKWRQAPVPQEISSKPESRDQFLIENLAP